MFQGASPTTTPPLLPAGNAPPTPPQNDLLDDIYGSAPNSPTLSTSNTAHITVASHHEILSDLPSRQRALDTDAYREGLASSKGHYVQEGFDEGYSLGANLGLLVGYILGVLQGITAALKGRDEVGWGNARALEVEARRELAIERLLGKEWMDVEGIWTWEVVGTEEEVTFREVAGQHPVVGVWMGRVGEVAERWSLDLEGAERGFRVGDETGA